MDSEEIRNYVRERYAQIAAQKGFQKDNACCNSCVPPDAGMESC